MRLLGIHQGSALVTGAAQLEIEQILLEIERRDRAIALLAAEREAWADLLETTLLGMPEGHA